ncbi:S phase cyclin A-associated protein in the endoplasmic reticulum [Anopheles bellator]|uniref:S phase cyclin A-associated protein in the endoplasmic reticulum n=1 Tax=Anopheles bellator TaxID=139047 RepID=UPI002649D7A9|nr:S phase cyclin A-associated protein in the endoplasmic reticulum [Anopheles bellator]
MENRKYFNQEGKEAKNFYHLSDDGGETHRGPPKRPPVGVRQRSIQPYLSHQQSKASSKSGPRVRSASTGRDKKSELQARYWAFLFGNLDRSINEIYKTVEGYENLSSCKETILVLENYIRDFKALAEWFKVSWDYEATPSPQRPLSLAWEVRKSNPVPRVRKPISSPGVSGKSSPSFSGKNSPCSVAEDPARNCSPKKAHSSTESLNKKAQNPTKPGPPSDPSGAVFNCVPLESYVLKLDQYTQTNLEDENLTLVEYLEKYAKQDDTGTVAVPLPGDVLLEPKIEERQNPQDEALVANVLKVDEKKVPQDQTKLHDPAKGDQSLARKLCPTKCAPVSIGPTKAASVAPRLGLVTVKSVASPAKAPTVGGVKTRPGTGPSGVVRKSATSSAVSHSNMKQAVNLPSKSATTPSLVASSSARNRNGLKQAYLPKHGSLGGTLADRSRLAVRSKTMIEVSTVGRPKFMPNIEDSRRRSTTKLSLLGNRSKEDVHSSSSTLKAGSSERLGSRSSITNIGAERKPPPVPASAGTGGRRSEPKTMPSSDVASNDGWYTVKTKRRSSLLWATRFNQPSGYASLPTLALLDENGTKMDERQNEAAKKSSSAASANASESARGPKAQQSAVEKSSTVAQSKPNGPSQPHVTSGATKMVKSSIAAGQPVLPLRPNNSNVKSRQQVPATVNRVSVSRQKSDLTGLKLKTLHKEFLRSEKLKSKGTDKLEPSVAVALSQSATVGRNASDGPTEPEADQVVQFNKVDMNIQTNLVTATIESLYATCLQETSELPGGKRRLPALSNGEALSHSTSDEHEEEQERDDMESDEDQRKLLEEQESLEAQIRELENTEIDFDTETDETDCEAIIDFEDTDGTAESGTDRPSGIEGSTVNGAVATDEDITLEMRYEAVLAEMSWVERARTLDTLKAIVARHPGRAQQLHAKLSSPSRRRSLHETLKKYQAKQARALEKRQALQKEKALKIQQLLARVEDVKAAKQCLIETKRLRMEERLQRAAENRSQYLKDKIKKAHDEEEKLKEIAFIKNLEAQNKRLDFMESWKEQEVRLQDLETERQKRAEEKAAKEAAVERRRQEIEQERQKKLQQMSENRREREKRVGKMQEQKERQRQALAREKARDREERLQALQAQKLATTEELQRKIIQKQQESARRHEENIEQIRQRAVELATIPSRSADELRNEDHDEDTSSVSERDGSIAGAPCSADGKRKVNRKRIKKLRQKLTSAAEEYLAELNPLAPSIRKQSQVPRLLGTVAKGGSGTLGVERPIGQLLRLIAKAEVADFQSLWLLDGLGTIATVIESGLSPGTDVSRKAVVLSVQLYRNACTLCPQIARHAVLGSSILILLDALQTAMKTPEEKNALFPVELSTELILACTVALLPTSPPPKQTTHPKVAERLPDLLSYIVSTGLIETLVKPISSVHESIENQTSLVLSLLASLGLLTKLVEICPKGPDVTKLLQTAQTTELFGTVSLLYAAIVPIGESIPPRTTSLAAATFNLLVTFANLDIEAFQAVLTQQTVSLKFLDVISILLQYCVPKADVKSETQTVIIDLTATLGFFCANNKENQDLLTSDQYTCVLKSLAKLPKQFDVITYPTLVSVLHDNPSASTVVGRDFNVELLEEYKRSDMAKKNRIVCLLL